MITSWSPAQWDDFGTVGLLLFFCALQFAAYLRGWLIPGRHHREIVDARDRELEQAKARALVDAETIHTLSRSLTEKNAMEDATTRILEALRGKQ